MKLMEAAAVYLIVGSVLIGPIEPMWPRPDANKGDNKRVWDICVNIAKKDMWFQFLRPDPTPVYGCLEKVTRGLDRIPIPLAMARTSGNETVGTFVSNTGGVKISDGQT